MDIEEIKKEGIQQKTCTYYASKLTFAEAEVIFM